MKIPHYAKPQNVSTNFKMKENNFITFQKYNSIDEAELLISALRKNGIQIQIQDDSPSSNGSFSINTFQNEIKVKLRQSDFETANQILEKQAAEAIDDLSKDNLLSDFTNIELLEIIEKPDEWSKEYYLLSQKILKERGQEINEAKVYELKKRRNEDLRKSEKGHSGWLIFGFISALLGGLFGIFIGWFYWTFKKTIPTGERVFAYNIETRKTGQKIFITGIISIVFWIIISIVR